MTNPTYLKFNKFHLQIPSPIHRNRLFFAILFLHFLGGSISSITFDIDYWPALTQGFVGITKKMLFFAPILGAAFISYRILYAAIFVRPERPIRWVIQDVKYHADRNIRFKDGAICFLAIGALITNFTCIKNVISKFNPFSWDTFLSNLDRNIHGGYQPWELLWPIFGTPYVTTILNFAYHAWFPLMYLTLFVASFDKRDPQRGMGYLVAFSLVFIFGGNVLATILSSVGPVYFDDFGFGDTYKLQMEGLQILDTISPVWALKVQDDLLSFFHNDGIIRGISAMPSMHVSSSVLMAIYAFRYSRWLGWLFTVFAMMIQVGSIHLAWHYAVDGYLGIIIAFTCWWLSNILTRKFYQTPSNQRTSNQMPVRSPIGREARAT